MKFSTKFAVIFTQICYIVYIMVNKTPQKRKEFTQTEIERFFEEVNRGGRIFSPTLNPEKKDSAADWVTTSGSSKQSNKLVNVSTWQTGQAS